MVHPAKVGVLGGGQLGRMLMESANRLNIQMNIVDTETAPAKQISAHNDHVTGSFMDREAVRKLAQASDVLTAEIEHVDTYALEEVESQVRIEPSWRSIRIIQNKFAQKEHLAKFGIPMAEYREVKESTTEELEGIATQLGYPLMLKSKTGAYDGRGKIVTSISFHFFILLVVDPAETSCRKLLRQEQGGYSCCTRSAQRSSFIC